MLKLQNRIITTVAREIDKRPDLIKLLIQNNPLGDIFSLSNDLSSERVVLYRKTYYGIGNTECYKINLTNNNKLLLKMEYTNAMGNTHYSRYWIIYLFISEILGVINPEETKIIEVTSGSSGIALSMAAEMLGYDVTIVVPSCLPENRIKPMKNKNTTIVKVSGYIENCILKLRELIDTGEYYATNHSEEKANIITYVFSRIAYEFHKEYGSPDYAILAFGNGSTTEAISKVLKEKNKETKIYSYRPDFQKHPAEIVFGLLAANINLRHVPIAEQLIDKLIYTSEIDLKEISEQYKFDTEISNLGPSSLYGIYFANEIAKTVFNKTFFTIGYDKKDRY